MPTVRPATSGPKHHFFGFHDLCPWDATGRYMLALETDFIDRMPRSEDKARICLIDLSKVNGQGSIVALAETSAWNFQQGSRLQWIPGAKKRIIYNDRRKDSHGWDKLVSVILDIETKEEKVLDYPIYAVSPNGDFALGIDFGALVGGYSYGISDKRRLTSGIKQVTVARESNVNGQMSNVNAGITKVNLDNGKTEDFTIIPEKGHVFTHVAFNPSGTRVAFIDKSSLPDGGFIQKLITADPDGSDPRTFEAHVTHYCWRNDTELLGYGKWSPVAMALRAKGWTRNPILKPFLAIARKMRGGLKQVIAGQSYLLFNDETREVKRVAAGVLTEDGHPMFSPDGKWFVTDTYPDRSHERALILYDWENRKKIDIGKFASLPKGFPVDWDVSGMRSDLHPRWNRNGTEICIDSVHEGTRQMYVVTIDH